MQFLNSLIAASTVVLFAAAAEGSPDADSSLQQRNCIDNCIIDFCRQAGHAVTVEGLDAAIDAAGLSRGAAFRSLADCATLLETVGVPVTAQYIAVNEHTRYPRLAIAYVPPMNDLRAGHVVVLSAAPTGEIQVFDPSARAPRFRIRGSDVRFSFDTIFLIPRTDAYHAAIGRLLKILAPTIVIGSIVFLGLRRRSQHTKAAGVAGQIPGTLIFLAMVGHGCSHVEPDQTSGITLDSETHDFGVVDEGQPPQQLNHVFVLSNRNPDPVVVTVRMSCSCVVSGISGSTIELPAGRSVNLPIAVNVAAKTGRFQETVELSFDQGGMPRRLLTLQGFISRCPMASTDILAISSLPGQQTSRLLELSYSRTTEQEPALLDSCRVLGAAPELTALFVVGRPSYQAGISRSGYPVDLWRIPITFQNGLRENEETSDRLELTWKSPPCVTYVRLRGSTEPVLHLAPRALIRDAVAGGEQVRTLPVRISDSEAAQRITIISPAEVSCQMLTRPDRLQCAIRPEEPGRFCYPVSLCVDGRSVATVELFGTAGAR